MADVLRNRYIRFISTRGMKQMAVRVILQFFMNIKTHATQQNKGYVERNIFQAPTLTQTEIRNTFTIVMVVAVTWVLAAMAVIKQDNLTMYHTVN